ncbi:TPA: Gfo/Idh/MocA family oxidoreductase [Candidatus Poribacteria bacterium]|nr:Gfo/Idh/MocA family oxidoreductase [Candidatus Poribacteria bacterium]
MGISLGLVGLGAFGSVFARLFKNHPLVDRVGLCDREPERVARFAEDASFGDKFTPSDAYESFDEIVNADFDALVIITQPWLHAEQAVRAMKAGKHVYSAVPVVTLPDGDEILDWCNKIIETCKSTGMRYMLGETTYYRPQTMYCRRKAAEGAFGEFVFSEGEYFHDIEHGLREVSRRRLSSKSGQEWVEKRKKYVERGIYGGPMHYPTHSVSGPMSVMKAHAKEVCAWGWQSQDDEGTSENIFSNETALFQMSNGSTMRICEYRRIGQPCREMFNILGTKGCFYGAEGNWGENRWFGIREKTVLNVEDMRESLPDEVLEAFQTSDTTSNIYGGHGGSHLYLAHEFVDAVVHERQPAINAWEAVRYMAAGVMAHKSALKDGETLEVPDWGDAPE